MSIIKRFALIMTFIAVSMLIIPLIAVNTLKADTGMLAVLILFFALYPVVCVCVGILAGRDIGHFWFSPVLTAVLFWFFSSFTYKTAFPVVYSAVYLVLCTVSMLITWIVSNKK